MALYRAQSAEPLYHQLKQLIKEKIETGQWQAGHRLPSETEFSLQYGVSRVTVRQALQLLRNEGLLERKQGLGTFVGAPKFAPNPVPLYHQLKELIKEKIESGEWQPGYQLPSETGLSAEYGVSRVTVRQAMQLLENQGLVERKQGVGTFVGRPKVAHNLMSFFVEGSPFHQAGSVPHMKLEQLEQRNPPGRVATRLDIGLGEKVFKLRRTFYADDDPVILTTSWLPAARVPDLGDKDLQSRSVRSVLLRDYGIENARQHKEVEVTMVDERDAELLKVMPGTPALLVTYVTATEDGRPFEYREMVVRGDRCKYFVDLETPESLF